MQLLIAAFACFGAVSCSDDNKGTVSYEPFDPSKPMKVESFFPDSGGVATPMLIYGQNFGSDTTGLSVYYIDEDGVKHKGGLVSSNGNMLYVYVPKGLTYKRTIDVQIERAIKGKAEPYVAKSDIPFLYRTQTAVTTIVGQPSPTVSAPTKPGSNLDNSTLSAPAFICVDNDENIFIAERPLDSGNAEKGHGGHLQCKKSDGNSSAGNFLRASLRNNEMVYLSEGKMASPNAPAFSDEKGLESVYVPEDLGLEFFQSLQSASYAPRRLRVIKDQSTNDIDKNNWKYCFVVNKNDKQLYTVMYKGQVVRINPKSRRAEIILKKIARHSAAGTDSYIAFSPIETNKLYVCLTDVHQIWTLNLDDLASQDKETYNGEPYAGRAIDEGISTKGWEDGLIRNAKFLFPRQICFTNDGKLYIADSGNSCIRTIDTTLPVDKATVTTPIGIPGGAGYQDGGPDIARFRNPHGVAVSPDGETVYVADTGNKVIRKLSIE